MPYDREIKGIRLLQDRAEDIHSAHEEIGSDIEVLKRRLMQLDGGAEVLLDPDLVYKAKSISEPPAKSLTQTPIAEIYAEAEQKYGNKLGLGDILDVKDFAEAEARIDSHVRAFNRKYALDGWDYAIAGGCGLFAAMLDLLCVKAPPKPTTDWMKQVDGIFNQGVQKAFDRLIPPELSHALSKANTIGAPDTSSTRFLVDAPLKALNPINHRLRSLAHDPLLGFIFGVLDMKNGTCTVVVDGSIVSMTSKIATPDGSVFQLLGRMLGHLMSDVNAPTANLNRGMGLPAPFMGLLRMFEGIPVGDSDFGKQIEYMYVNGYDFRQFVTASIPATIMEIMMRAFYAIKQQKQYDAGFWPSLVETLPLNMNPRFRMMMAIAYGTFSSVNAGKMYVTQNIMNANYAAWMGLAWNSFHALRWALFEKDLKLWGEVEAKEIEQLQSLVQKIDTLQARAEQLPT